MYIVYEYGIYTYVQCARVGRVYEYGIGVRKQRAKQKRIRKGSLRVGSCYSGKIVGGRRGMRVEFDTCN